MQRGSIIIPVRNDPARLIKLLNSFSATDWKDHEVLVIDDGSTDDTAEVAATHPVRVVRNDGPPGPSAARNLGVRVAREDVVLFIDSDVVLEPGAITRVMEWFNDPQVFGVSTIASEVPENPGIIARYCAVSDRYVAERWDPSSAARDPKDGVRTVGWLSTRFGAMRKQAFDEVGGFDVRFDRPSMEDAEFSIRLARKCSLILDLDAAHTHHWPTSILRVIRRTFLNSYQLMKVLREQHVAVDNIVDRSERIGRILCALALLLLFTALFSRIAAAAAAACFLITGWSYRDLFRAYRRAGGTLFMIGAVLLHYIVTFAGLAGVAIAILIPPWSGRIRQEQS